MTDINDLNGRFYIQETHIRLKDGGKTTHKNGVVYTPAECVDTFTLDPQIDPNDLPELEP